MPGCHSSRHRRRPFQRLVHRGSVSDPQHRAWLCAARPKAAAELEFRQRQPRPNHGRQTFVYNGFPTDAYRLAGSKNDRLLFLAGIARAGKNLNRAVDLAKKFDFPLDIAGGSRWKLLGRSQTRRGRLLRSGKPLPLPWRRRWRREAAPAGRGESLPQPDRLGGAVRHGAGRGDAVRHAGADHAARRAARIVDADTGLFFDTDAEFGTALAAIATCPRSAAANPPPTGFQSPEPRRAISNFTREFWTGRRCRERTSLPHSGLYLDSAPDFLSTAPEIRDEYPSEQADQDAEASLRPSAVNRSWRPTPGSAERPRVLFGFGALLGHLARTHYFSGTIRGLRRRKTDV